MKSRDSTGWTLIQSNGKVTPIQPKVELLDITRLAFLAQAGSRLPASLDESVTLRNIAETMVPFLADVSFIYASGSDACTRRVGAARKSEWRAFTSEQRYPNPEISTTGPEIISPITDEWLKGFTDSAEELAELSSCNFCSALRFPLLHTGECLGSVTLLSTRRTYHAEDLVLALEVGARSSLALHNCRQHAAALRESRQFPQRSIAILNHELRNFVSPILGWARVFRSDTKVARDPILAEGSESLERNATHMTRLLNDCLDLSSVGEGKLQIDRTVLDLNGVIRAAADSVKQPLHEKRHILTTEVTSRPIWVQGDATRLQQVITNLLLNAIKYTQPRGFIRIRTIQHGSTAEVSISDNGRGIPSSDLHNVFEPFYRGDQPSYGGLGLGLAISRQIVSLHGGSIWAESAGEGRGSVFRLTLPCSLVEPPTSVPLSTPSQKTPSRRILLVEDAADVRTLMRLQMEAMGHSVWTAHGPADALRQARRSKPDLIISDIRMAGLDGYSLARSVHSDSATAEIPLLAITGMSARANLDQAKEAGFAACLLKPVEDEVLSDWIDRLTRAR